MRSSAGGVAGQEVGDGLHYPLLGLVGVDLAVGRGLLAGLGLVQVEHDVLVGDPLQPLLAADALEGELLLVEGVDLGQLEAGRLRRVQDRLPDAVVGVVEDHAGPAPRLEHAVHLAEGVGHQAGIVGQGVLVLVLDVDHRLLALVGEALVEPGLPDQVAVGVEDVGAEGWVGEDVVNLIWRAVP